MLRVTKCGGWLIGTILVAIYSFLGMANLMKGSIWVLRMMGARGAQDDANALADLVRFSGDL